MAVEVTQEHAVISQKLDNTQSASAENVYVSAWPSNTQRVSTEHVLAASWPANVLDLSQMFVVVATREVPMAEITLRKTLVPTTDPGRFDLAVDGFNKAVSVGDGGTSGAVVVTAGAHVVSESGVAATNLADYRAEISGAAADGSVALAEGESKTVTFINTRIHAAPPGGGASTDGGCPPAFTLRRIALTLRRTTHLPVRGADT